jgi:hypothetical protein
MHYNLTTDTEVEEQPMRKAIDLGGDFDNLGSLMQKMKGRMGKAKHEADDLCPECAEKMRRK